MNIKVIVPIVILSSLGLISCGGSGSGSSGPEGATYRGVTTEATVTTENVGDIAVSTTAGANFAITSDVSGFSARGTALSNQTVLSFILQKVKLVSQQSKNGSLAGRPETCPNGGSISSSGNESSGTARFNSCRIEFFNPITNGLDYIVLNGTLGFEFSSNGTSDFSVVKFSNFSFRLESGVMPTQSITMTSTETCLVSDPFNCTFRLDFVGIDNRTYRIDGEYIISSSLDGFDVITAIKIYDPDYGFVKITADNISYKNPVGPGNCAGGVPGAGVITITGSSIAVVTFNDCDSFTVTPPGSTPGGAEDKLYLWANIL